MGLASGYKLGPYEIVAPLGAGGMGEVYRAHDSRLNRDVAIKILPQRLAQSPVVHGPANENWGRFRPMRSGSPNSSDETGRAENYVVPFPGPGGKWQVSTTGGINSYWPVGNQFFYATPEAHIIAVDLTTQGTNLLVSKSRVILSGRALGASTSFNVTRDGKRWLVALPVAESNASPLILNTNWAATLGH